MPTRVLLDFPEVAGVHRVRNLGMALYQAFQDERIATMDINAIDQSTIQLVIDLPYPLKAKLKAARTIIDRLLSEHMLQNEAYVSLRDA